MRESSESDCARSTFSPTLSILWIILFLQLLNAGNPSNRLEILKADACHFAQTGVAIFTAPINYSASQWSKITLVSIGTAGLFAADPAMKSFALNHQTSTNDHIFNFDAYHGDKYTWFFSLSVYSIGWIFGSEKVRETGLMAIEAFLYAGTITQSLKFLLGRRRPFGGDNFLIFKPFHGDYPYRSLPSGHATAAFAVSTVMAKSWSPLWWKIFWYGSATMVGFSRIYHNAHWFSDVFLGSAIGYSVADFVVARFADSEKKVMAHKHLKLRPRIGFRQFTFDIIYLF